MVNNHGNRKSPMDRVSNGLNGLLISMGVLHNQNYDTCDAIGKTHQECDMFLGFVVELVIFV